MARVTVQGKTASNSLVDLLVNEDGSLSGGGSGGATASEIGAAVNTLPALTNRSGTVTTGGTAQQIMAANASRTWGSFTNLDVASGWISETGTAVVGAAGSTECKQGATMLLEGGGAVSYIHPTTGAKFTSVEG